jgi:N-acetylglucosamine-6-sulfatase
MNQHVAPTRRRAITAATATLTALAIVAGFVVLTGVTSTPSQASTGSVDALPSASASIEVGPEPSVSATPAAPATATASPTGAPTGSVADIKNVVLILADDLDWALFDRIPRLAALKAEGMTFANSTVTDSLCCPSRTSILRSQYIHNHRVVSNIVETGGGWPTFKALGEQKDCLPVWLKSAGVTTGLFGKYLNDYTMSTNAKHGIPPGWDQFAVPVSHAESYSGYDYTLNDNGTQRSYGSRPKDFLNDVITKKATDFIRTSPDGFFLELASFSPHRPAPVATRNKGTHLGEVAPRFPNYNVYGTNEPTWMRKLRTLDPQTQGMLDAQWRQRAQSAESIADSVDAVRAELAATGRSANTLIIVTSDNGYHAGAHRMRGGKRTAFREDTVVPMVVIGPGVAPGSRVDAMTSTVDLAPTITDLLGAQSPAWIDGRSLTGILGSGQVPTDWRTAALSESMGQSAPKDPDYQADAPPNFSALRTPQWLFVVYRSGERELYDLANDPYELNNIASTADAGLVAGLYSQLQALRSCVGPTCRTADSIPIPIPAVPLAP